MNELINDNFFIGFNEPEQTEVVEEVRENEISVVVPVLNEEESLKELASKLEDVLNENFASDWEVFFIDDGSTDKSFEVIRELNRQNPNFKGISFRRNYGKSAALAVGFKYSKGKIIVTMDGDLQDDPSEIPHLKAKLDQGYDLVSGWKKVRHDPITKTAPSKLFNYVTSKISGVCLHDFNCGLKMYRAQVVKSVQVYGEMHRYIPVLAHLEGFKVTEIPVHHHARKYGKSKYRFARFFNGFLDLLTIVFTSRFMKRPLHFFGTVGIVLTLIGCMIDLVLVIEKICGLTDLTNRPLMTIGIAMIIVGIQSISTGLLGEMIVKNNADRINYSVKEILK